MLVHVVGLPSSIQPGALSLATCDHDSIRKKGMWRILKRLVTAPTFADKQQSQAARWLNRLALSLITLVVADSILVLFGVLDQDALAQILVTNALTLAINLGVLLLMRRGQVKLA